MKKLSTRDKDKLYKKADALTNKVIGLAIKVHKNLGPGLLENAYKLCLCYEFSKDNFKFEVEKSIPLLYNEIKVDCAYKADVIVEKCLLLELKSVKKLLPIHLAQILTYMKLANISLGLLINFNVRYLKDGIKRVIL